MADHWLTCAEPFAMLRFLAGKLTTRQRQLFACHCAQKVPAFAHHEVCRRTVDMVEAWADGSRPDETYLKEITYHLDYCLETGDRFDASEAEAHAAADVLSAELSFETATTGEAIRCHPIGRVALYAATHGRHGTEGLCDLIREIAGNPFRRVLLDPSSQSTAVTSLATAIYEGSRYCTFSSGQVDPDAFQKMPILADALEEAGCTNQDILQHCRADAKHVRGCWVIDLLLNKK